MTPTMLSEQQLVELARKHKAPLVNVRWLTTQLFGLSLEMARCADDQILRLIADERSCGRYHAASVIWFIQTARKGNLDWYQATDLFVALAVGDA